MLPNNEINLDEVDFEENSTSKVHKMHKDNHISGKVDNELAMKQLIYKILNTERYDYPIYTDGYGVEFVELIGKPVDYVIPELERRIKEALEEDERILSCKDFEFQTKLDSVLVKFTVSTIYGTINEETEVKI